MNAMDLPELRLMLARHLSPADLQACALVCRAWHRTFNAFVWSRVTVIHLPDADRLHSPIRSDCCAGPPCKRCGWRQAVGNNGHFIRHLIFQDILEDSQLQEFLGLFKEKCTLLSALAFRKCAVGIENYAPIWDLLEQNPGLQYVSTDNVMYLTRSLNLTNLKILEVNASLSVDDVRYLLAAFPLLQDLTLSCALSSSSQLANEKINVDESARDRPSPLRRLAMGNLKDAPGIGPLLERCPNLEHLELQHLYTVDSTTIRVLQSGLLSRLTSVSFDQCIKGGVAQQVIRVLPHHQIRELRISRADTDSIHDIVKYLGQWVEHLSFERPWACVLLEHLVIPIALERQYCDDPGRHEPAAVTEEDEGDEENEIGEGEEEKEEEDDDEKAILIFDDATVREQRLAEELFMERLSALTRLRRLVLSNRPSINMGSENDMSWRLMTGLSWLKGLRRLELLHLGHRRHLQGIAEYHWMRQHFVSLSKLVVSEVGNEQKRDWLRVHWPQLTVVELLDKE
ncbi:hypothetical protein DFQ27_003329 [Actinomortierella ambigua]|uniref:F-box domain-containing protein n=1 Tax=Actinomortierella ambigua TaxID=1343610 RepID=A0A9P6Q749_9FUNG|nr:hypothetical protein DFQ27_003329 [Actinomortierella ambigua]